MIVKCWYGQQMIWLYFIRSHNEDLPIAAILSCQLLNCQFLHSCWLDSCRDWENQGQAVDNLQEPYKVCQVAEDAQPYKRLWTGLLGWLWWLQVCNWLFHVQIKICCSVPSTTTSALPVTPLGWGTGTSVALGGVEMFSQIICNQLLLRLFALSFMTAWSKEIFLSFFLSRICYII